MWDMVDGRAWAIFHLRDAAWTEFTAVMKLHVAIKYDIPEWISPAFTRLVVGDWKMGQLVWIPGTEVMVEVLDLILKTRDILDTERRRLAAIPPVAIRGPECSDHHVCQKAWTEAWVLKIGRRLIHPQGHYRLEYYEGSDEVMKLKIPGMNPACRHLTTEMVTEEGDGFAFEQAVIQQALRAHGYIQ
jgi:hypothetical protein